MTDIFYLIVMVLLMSFAQFFGGYFVLRGSSWVSRSQEYLLALSAGFLMALALANLIPESISLSHFAPLYVILGFSLLHFFEHSIIDHMHFGEEKHGHEHIHSSVSVYSTFFGLLIHAVFDGIALSAAYFHDWKTGVLAFIGILLHKFPEGFTIATLTKAAELKSKQSYWAVIGLAMGSIIGFGIILLLDHINNEISAVLLGLAAGITLYIAAIDLIPEINKSNKRFAPLTVFFGMLLYWLVIQSFGMH